ncbi:transcriptional regulator PpsR [Blastochloris viridis]|uniref:Regulator of carotenoid biosynthesis n=1 Tax=Blastochloris viridis TaxID=1079 RepID=A0A182CZ00_BLAVI|nr:transcriptional regulator PpsR [Blastochloris viridis]ALK08364.1 sensory histidine kinase AtoS [Blastochloris viridis]BAR98364.1 regulator of carotenoid biosynthesis [Blastochloris viridis]
MTPVSRFKTPEQSLGELDTLDAAKLIAAAADIALILDQDGVIQDVAFGSEDLQKGGFGPWQGQRWVDTVTVESRTKVEQLLKEAADSGTPRWREISHAAPRGGTLLVRYSAVRLGDNGRVVAIGRDLRAIANLQQRLIAAQQSMEREYARLRHAETRYRLLFHLAAEAVLIVDVSTQKIVEANPSAAQLLGMPAGRLVGKPITELFADSGASAVQNLLVAVRGAGWADDVRARLANGEQEFSVSASIFRQENASHFLLRLASLHNEPSGVLPRAKSKLLKVVDSMPDALVVTGPDHTVLDVNPAFLDMAQLATEEQARGEPLDRWLGRNAVDFSVLVANLREYGSVRNFSTVVHGEFGSIEEVEISAVAVINGEQPCDGFVIRHARHRETVEPTGEKQLPRSVEQLTGLVGRVSLKELVRETTDVIERLCIQAALTHTGDNRASAAQMLGLSRQSLYAKLRRFGMGDLGPDEAEDAEES